MLNVVHINFFGEDLLLKLSRTYFTKVELTMKVPIIVEYLN